GLAVSSPRFREAEADGTLGSFRSVFDCRALPPYRRRAPSRRGRQEIGRGQSREPADRHGLRPFHPLRATAWRHHQFEAACPKRGLRRDRRAAPRPRGSASDRSGRGASEIPPECYSSTPESRYGNQQLDRKSTRLNSSHVAISYAVFCLKKKKQKHDVS